jgi:hypothetical protein
MRLSLLILLASWSASAWGQPGEPMSPPPTVAPPPMPAQVPPSYPQAYPAYPPGGYPPPYYFAPGAPTPAASAPAPSPSPYPAPIYYYPPPYPYPLPVYEPPEPPPPPMTTVSLTLSTIHLLLPVVELTGELRLGTKGGVALIAGGGWITDTASDGTKVTFRVWELGSQLRYYITGNFRRGMQVGAEVLYLHVNGSLADITGVGQGLALGPFFGWKTTSYVGFTFEVQGGVEIVTSGTKVTDSSGPSTSSSVDYIPLLNLNIGWSF